MSSTPRNTALLLVLGLLAGAGAATGPRSAYANPIDAFGLGARAVSMGGAYTGVADDSSANYYNPAGLARTHDLRIELGYTANEPTLRFDGGDANVDHVRGMQLGVVLPGEVLSRRFGAGLSLMLLDDRVTRVRSLPQQQPRFVLFDNRVQRLYISANFALEPIDHVFIGGGLTFMANTSGVLEIEGLVSLDDNEDTVLQGAVDVNVESARYGQVGILIAPDAPWTLGLVWRQDYRLELGIGTLVTGQIAATTLGDDPFVIVEDGRFFFDSFNSNLFSPMQVVLGGSYDFGRVLVSADIGWYRWSEFPAPTSTVEIDLDLGTLDFSVPPTDPVQDPNFHDLIIPRLGVEGVLFEGDHAVLRARGGYFYEASPAPDQPGLTNYADSDKHGLSLGFGVELRELGEALPKPIVLDLAFLYLHLTDREYEKDDPADLIGDYGIDGHILGLGLTFGLLL
jgi:long-chain fatty acid transport protein